VSEQVILLTQRPDHVAHQGETVFIDGDPFVIKGIKPKRESGCFLDWGQSVEFNEVEVVVERFDGYDK
jgi:hypothetical protein